MTKIIVGLFDTISDAQEAIQDLRDAGFSSEDISFLARSEQDVERADTGTEMEEDAAVGATGGAVVGGLGGLLVGIGAITIPGIGPAVGAGALLTTLAGAGVGAAAGGLVGALIGAGIPEEEAHVYAEAVRRGAALVTIQTDTDEEAYRAADILNRHNAVDIDQRGREYREAGWTGFDEDTRPYDLSYSTAGGGDYARSSKAGTSVGVVAGAATGAALGSAGGPAGTVIGGAAGAAVGGGIGAAGDTASVASEDDTPRPVDNDATPDRTATDYDRTVGVERPADYDTTSSATLRGTTSPSYATGAEVTDEGGGRPADYGTASATDTAYTGAMGTTQPTDVEALPDQSTPRGSRETGATSTEETTEQRESGLTDRIEDVTSLDIDRDGDVAGRDRRDNA